MSGAGKAWNDRRFSYWIYQVSDCAALSIWLHSLTHKVSINKCVRLFRPSDWFSRYRHPNLERLKICVACYNSGRYRIQIPKFPDTISFVIIPRVFWRSWTKIGQIYISYRFVQSGCNRVRQIDIELGCPETNIDPRFLEVVSFSMKQRRQKVWKFINCTPKDIMSTKTMKELCASRRFSFVFGCELSGSAGNLLKCFSRYCKNWPMRVICRAGKWTEITVIPSHVFFILVKLESKKCKWYCCLLTCSATNFVSTSSVLRDITRCI